MNKKVFIISSVLLFIFSIFITMQTYSYFSTTITGKGKLVFANWNFRANNSSTSFVVDLGELYPGINRSYQLRLSAVGSDVPVNYTITFNHQNNIPINLKFYEDSSKLREINLNGGTVSGVLGAGTETVITIYYDWPYGSTAEEYVPGTAWFDMTIIGHQIDPSGGV